MRILFLILLLFSAEILQAQTIKGTVREKETGLPLPFANVFVNNTTLGVASDREGHFILTGTFSSEIEIVASFVGYVTEVKSISFKEENEIKVEFELSFKESSLSEIELKAKRDKSWEREFRRFEEAFLALPDDPYKEEIEILNPWVLDFGKVKANKGPNYLQATTQEPLKIKNKALGYDLTYYLEDFRVMRNGTRFFGQVFYEPIKSINPQESEQWIKARENNYHSSLRHLNQSILLNSSDSIHFRIYQVLPEKLDRRRTNEFYEELNKSIVSVPKDSILRRPMGDGTYRIFLPSKMEINNLDKSWRNDYYTNVYHAISWIEAPEGYYDIDLRGTLINPTQLVLSGYLSRQRVARILPLDFEPNENFSVEKLQPEVIMSPALRLNRLREKAWLTTNKSYFYPGETAWIGGRMLYQEPTLGDSLSRLVYVDLINSYSEVIQSATFPIQQGKISGGFVVPQDLEPGDYALRAYTHWNRNFGELDQFLTPFLVMEPGYQPKVDIPESDAYSGEIQVNTSFTTSDSLSYRIMDLSVAMLDDFQNPIDGEFILSITDAESVFDVQQAGSLEQAMNWLDKSLPLDFDSDLSYPIEYGISIQGKFIPSNKRQPLINPITIVRGDLEDYGQVTSDSAGRFWATGLYFTDTAQIAIAAVDSKLRPFGSVELNPLTKPASPSQFLKIRYQKIPVSSTDNLLDVAGDYILLEEFVKEEIQFKETMAQRNYGYGPPDREVNEEELFTMTPAAIQQRIGLLGGKLGNYNTGQKTGQPLLIVDGAQRPFADFETYFPAELRSIKVYTLNSHIFGMAGYSGVIMIETRSGFKTKAKIETKFNSEGFQIFSVAGYTEFQEFPKDPTSDQYLKKKPTIYWEPDARSEGGALKVQVKIPYGVRRLGIRIEGVTVDGEAFYKKIDLSL